MKNIQPREQRLWEEFLYLRAYAHVPVACHKRFIRLFGRGPIQVIPIFSHVLFFARISILIPFHWDGVWLSYSIISTYTNKCHLIDFNTSKLSSSGGKTASLVVRTGDSKFYYTALTVVPAAVVVPAPVVVPEPVVVPAPVVVAAPDQLDSLATLQRVYGPSKLVDRRERKDRGNVLCTCQVSAPAPLLIHVIAP